MNSGLYVALVRLRRPADIGLGTRSHRLPPGWYAYTGSARRGLDARVARHLAPTKKVRWHIDRLTTHPAATVVGAVLLPSPETLAECALNRWVGHLVGDDAPIKGFGAGDCRSGCPAHLWRCDRPLTPKALAAEMTAAGLGSRTVVHNPRARPSGP